MEILKYKVIKTKKQYDEYCQVLHDLNFSHKKKSKKVEEEMELLTVLIEKYDEDHSIFNALSPVELLRSLMKDHHLNSVDLSNKLKVSPGLVSDILNYKKRFSKDIIHHLVSLFKLSQEAFNRPYKLKISENSQSHNTGVINGKRKRAIA